MIQTNYPREQILARCIGAVTVRTGPGNSAFLCSTAAGVDAFLLIVPAEWKKGEV